MVTTTSLKVGESLSIGLYFKDNYQLPTTCNLVVFIGGACVGNLFTQEPKIERVGIYYTIRLSSQDTSKMRGYRDLIVVLDDPDGFGNKKFIVGGILFDRMAGEFITTSEHQGYNMLIGMTVDESIVSGNVELIEAIKGDSAFMVWQKQAGNQGKTYDDYIAYLREPMTQAIAEGEQTAAEWAVAENARRAAEVIREQVKDATIIAKDEAIQAASDANDAAILANEASDRIPIIIYLSENEYQVLLDNDLVLPNAQYNIYE